MLNYMINDYGFNWNGFYFVFVFLPQTERSKQVFGSVRQALDHISARAIFK